ncbi:MAG TPA: alternative ribosome rescue aminoacyl-tRNA hydrolase ArfB [Cyclobacteriaceae bacterium]|jgi:ribosome-associated protein|nr:aminoacyl-tRNA hydrolase [Cyclobacteriaceae bacterium]HNP08804.1 alternative ribosome rescue aminoacyl-tRNA hydrolase ArfB [Cyclobacteriaceae bacterium]HRK53099.1 alternative ribosome rescue aminoacyl-tRNA hydrolase ArfB [Cyclobacteriaceae bacterium]
MPERAPNIEDIKDELIFSTSRSGGPGGQNVNKVSSKVTLKWDVAKSTQINSNQKDIIFNKLKNRLTKEQVLVLQEQESRSQFVNKEEVIIKLNDLLRKAFVVKKKRKPTKPTKTSIHKRVKEKKLKGEKKQWRQKPDH